MTWSRIHSAPLRVLPKPRPASSSQVRQSPFGACWLGRPHQPQSCSIALIVGPKDGATIPAKGQPIKLFGVNVSNEPDAEDGPGERTSEPRFFPLETETPSPSAPVAHQSAVSM